MESVLDDCLAQQIRAQRRAVPGCFGFNGAKECCGGSSTGFGKSLIYHLFAAVKLKQREKYVVFASSLRSIIIDQVEAMR